jgi:hypothetical protein
MKGETVRSSNLRSVGYGGSTQMLEIAFNSGGVYKYSQVLENAYDGLTNAPAHGRYFNHFIKSKYPTRGVT